MILSKLFFFDTIYPYSLHVRPALSAQVPRRNRRRPHGRHICLCQPAINHEIRRVEETALVARQKHHRLGLLNSFAETAGREMHFTAEPLVLVVAEEILEQGSASECVSMGL